MFFRPNRLMPFKKTFRRFFGNFSYFEGKISARDSYPGQHGFRQYYAKNIHSSVDHFESTEKHFISRFQAKKYFSISEPVFGEWVINNYFLPKENETIKLDIDYGLFGNLTVSAQNTILLDEICRSLGYAEEADNYFSRYYLRSIQCSIDSLNYMLTEEFKAEKIRSIYSNFCDISHEYVLPEGYAINKCLIEVSIQKTVSGKHIIHLISEEPETIDRILQLTERHEKKFCEAPRMGKF